MGTLRPIPGHSHGSYEPPAGLAGPPTLVEWGELDGWVVLVWGGGVWEGAA
jgi:hypothetical protein